MKKFPLILDNKGLTLVELMIVMALSLLLMAAVYMTFQLEHTSSQSQTQVSATQQDLRAAMDIIAVDIMNAGANPHFNKNQTVLQGLSNACVANSIELFMDLNSSDTTNAATDGGEHITYVLNGGQIIRNDINAGLTQVIAYNVNTLEFKYYDINYAEIAPATNAEDIRLVKVRIVKNSDQRDQMTGQFVTRTLERIIGMRNITTL